jgi:hypothetical protein
MSNKCHSLFSGVETDMGPERSKMKWMLCVCAVILLVIIAFLPLQSMKAEDGSTLRDFILSPNGGGMFHCDPQMSENIRLPVPTDEVDVVWYRHDLGGELFGTQGNGIAGRSSAQLSSPRCQSLMRMSLEESSKSVVLRVFEYLGYTICFRHIRFPPHFVFLDFV